MATRLPAIKVMRKSGKECFQGMEGERTLKDFWAWAFSDLVSNTERGKLAEYIVATAMGCDEGTSPTWGSFDLLSPEGIKIEVKASAYIQSWEQKDFSRIEFSIAESLYWDGVAYAKEKKRQAGVYVFCVLKHKEQDTINPLDLEQWDFYPVSTARVRTRYFQRNKNRVCRGHGGVACVPCFIFPKASWSVSNRSFPVLTVPRVSMTDASSAASYTSSSTGFSGRMHLMSTARTKRCTIDSSGGADSVFSIKFSLSWPTKRLLMAH